MKIDQTKFAICDLRLIHRAGLHPGSRRGNSRLDRSPATLDQSVQTSPDRNRFNASTLYRQWRCHRFNALASAFHRFTASTSAFTMMEIAICLAVIGIALVAIIGVLPIGMNVQQNNRQETIIGQDATVFMEAIRNGSLGIDDLTNYVYAVSNYWADFGPIPNGTNALGINGYTFSSYSIARNYYTQYGTNINNGANIVGLMSMPEFTDGLGNPLPNIFNGGYSNHVVVYCRSVSGPAIEKPPQDNSILQQDSFSYRIFCVNAPPALNTNDYWPGNTPSPYDVETFAALHELRLTFLWPQLPNGNLGPGRETFRTEVAGQLLHQPPGSPVGPFTTSNPFSTVWDNPNFWCYVPDTFEAFTNLP